jgi:hypothetical protein
MAEGQRTKPATQLCGSGRLSGTGGPVPDSGGGLQRGNVDVALGLSAAARYLAAPLLLYVVGMPDPHLAIGTSAVAVAVNAFANLVPHHSKTHTECRSR